MSNNKQIQYTGLDLLKFSCSILIVFLHINPFPKEALFYNLSRAVANVGVPCFFIISGFLLFEKVFQTKEREERSTIIKKQLKRLLCLLGLWCAVYFVLYDLWWIRGEDCPKTGDKLALNLLEYIHHILFGGEGFYLWYVVALIVAIILCYALHDKNQKIVIPLMLILLVIGMLGTSYVYLIENTQVSLLFEMYAMWFTTFRNGVFFGAPCVYMGVLLAKNDYASWRNSVFLLAISIILFVAEFIMLRSRGETYHVMQITIISVAFSLVAFLKNIKMELPGKFAWYLRKLSFLIYMIHPLLIMYIPRILHALRGIDYYWYLWYGLQIPIVIFVSIAGGCILIQLSAKVRLLKYMM